jgi:hypothetical protein
MKYILFFLLAIMAKNSISPDTDVVITAPPVTN